MPRHHVNHEPWHRHAVLYQVLQDEDGSVRTVSSLIVHQTLQDVGDTHVYGGSTNVFAVGRYHDRFHVAQGRFLLTERTVRLATRQRGVGSHLIV